MKSLSRVWLLATPWTTAHKAPPSMGFSRQEFWSGVPLPSPFLRLKALITWPCLHSSYSPEKFSETNHSNLGSIQHCIHPNFWSFADFLSLVFSFPFLKGFASISAFLLKLVRSHPMTKRSYLPTCSSCLLFMMTRKMRCWMTHTASWAHRTEVYTSIPSLEREEILACQLSNWEAASHWSGLDLCSNLSIFYLRAAMRKTVSRFQVYPWP